MQDPPPGSTQGRRGQDDAPLGGANLLCYAPIDLRGTASLAFFRAGLGGWSVGLRPQLIIPRYRPNSCGPSLARSASLQGPDPSPTVSGSPVLRLAERAAAARGDSSGHPTCSPWVIQDTQWRSANKVDRYLCKSPRFECRWYSLAVAAVMSSRGPMHIKKCFCLSQPEAYPLMLSLLHGTHALQQSNLGSVKDRAAKEPLRQCLGL